MPKANHLWLAPPTRAPENPINATTWFFNALATAHRPLCHARFSMNHGSANTCQRVLTSHSNSFPSVAWARRKRCAI